MEQTQTNELKSEAQKPRELVGFMAIKISDNYAKIVTNNQAYNVEQNEALKKAYADAAIAETFAFYENVRSVLSLVKPYVRGKDIPNFETIYDELSKEDNKKLFNLGIIREVCEFTQNILKESGIANLSIPNRHREISKYIEVA